MTWDEFRDLLVGISPETPLGRIVSIRAEEDKEVLKHFTKEQLRMFEVRPGITGWAQVNGRKDVEWNRRIELNVWYVRHVRFSLDAKIFFMTIFKVLTNADNENIGETLEK